MNPRKVLHLCRACVLVPLFLTTGTGHLSGQEMLGVINGNYSGVNGLLINPANAGITRSGISINLLGGDFFLNSNYFFVNRKDYSFIRLFSLDINDPAYMHIYDFPEYLFRDTVHYFDYFKNTDQKYLFSNLRIAGPSLTIRMGRHAFSLVTGWRNNLSVEKFPYNAANFIFRGQDYSPQHNITYDEGYFTFTALSWIELGLGYSYTVYKDDLNEINAGITAKGLLCTGAAYGIVDNVTYMVPNTDSIYFYKMNATVGLDLPMNYADNSFPVFDPFVRGTGFSGDIGINYIYSGGYDPPETASSRNRPDPEQKYLFRMGLSLLDAGWIRLHKGVQVHEFNDVDNRLWSGLRNYHACSVQNLLRSASYNLLGDSLASLTGITSFTTYLPTAASFQLDYYVGYNLFVNATVVQGIRLGKPSVRRPTLISITPRYETPIYEVSLPVSLVDFENPAIGLAVRIYSLVIGTEKLGTFLNLTDVKGIDFYFSLGINLNPKNNRWSFKGTREAPCDAYPDYRRYQVR